MDTADRIHVLPTYEAMCAAAGEHIIKIVTEKPDALIELPGGDTPLGIFDYLVKAAKNGFVGLNKCSFVSLDEWEGLDESVPGSCRETLFSRLYRRLPIDINRQVCFFDGTANLEGECARVDAFVRERGGIDVAVLGIGMNGHVGFNEPGIDPNQYCTIVPLDSVTRDVSVKYFGGKQLNIARGITLGMRYFFEAGEVMLIANAIRKANIVQKLVEGPKSRDLPASLISHQDNCTIWLDEAAASKLSRR